MSKVKKVFTNSVLYSLSSILFRAASLILFPIFSAYLAKEDYGILSITQGILSLLTVLGGLELARAATRFIYDNNGKAPEENARNILGNYLVVQFFMNGLLVLVLFFFGEPWLTPMLHHIGFEPFMLYTLYAMPLLGVIELYRTYLRALQQGSRLFWFDICYSAANIGLNLFLVIYYEMGVLGIIVSTLINGVVFSLYAFFVYFIKTRFRINLKALKEGLSFSVPLVPYILFGILLEQTDKVILNVKFDEKLSGIYYIAFTFASIFSILKESFLQAYIPWFYENFKSNNFVLMNRISSLVIRGLGVAGVGLCLFGYEVLYLLSNNPDLVEAYVFIPWIVVGLYIVFAGQLFNLPVYHEKTMVKWLFTATVAGVVFNALASFLTIEHWGIMGSVFSKIMGYSAMVIISWLLYLKVSTYRFRLLGFWAMLFVMIALAEGIPRWPFGYTALLMCKVCFLLALLGWFFLFVKKNAPEVLRLRWWLKGF